MTKLITSANTCNGFAIGIVQQPRTAGYAVVRIDDEHRYVVLGRRPTEPEARKLANAEWKADMGRR